MCKPSQSFETVASAEKTKNSVHSDGLTRADIASAILGASLGICWFVSDICDDGQLATIQIGTTQSSVPAPKTNP